MLRHLVGCAVALALLVPAQAAAAQPSSATDQRAAATAKSRDVWLGHKPVRATTADKVRLTFKGRKGQLVNLARLEATQQCGRRVLRLDGKTVESWAQGYWRLPRTAAYTAINKPCRTGDETSLKLQVRRAVREDRLGADTPITAGASTRVTHLVPFRVDDQQRVGVSGPDLSLIGPDRSITRDIGPEGYVIRDYPGPLKEDVPSPRGRYFVELAPEARVSLSVTWLLPASVYGPGVVVARGTRETAATSLVFEGEAGQWIYSELTSASGGADETRWWLTQLRNAAGEFPTSVMTECPWNGQGSCAVTQLPTTGTYLMDVLNAPGYGTEISVRVRSAARAAPATVNGPAVPYTATSPGQWVVGQLPELARDASGGSGATITLSNASGSLSDWRVRAVSGYGPCNTPALAVDCFNIYAPPNAFTLTPSTLSSPLPWDAFANPAVAVLAVPPGVTGSLDLGVTRP